MFEQHGSTRGVLGPARAVRVLRKSPSVSVSYNFYRWSAPATTVERSRGEKPSGETGGVKKEKAVRADGTIQNCTVVVRRSVKNSCLPLLGQFVW